MKFVFMGPVYPFRGGIAYPSTKMLEALIKKGHAVFAYSFSRMYPKGLYPGEGTKDFSQASISMAVDYAVDSLNPFTWFRVAREIYKLTPDVILLPWWTGFFFPLYLFLRVALWKIPFLFVIHNVFPHESTTLNKMLSRIILNLGDGFLVQSDNERRKLLSILNKDFPIMQCEMPPFDEMFPKKIEKDVARQTLSISLNQPAILFLGIVRPYKGVDVLLQASAILRKRNFQHQLVIAGEFWDALDKYTNLIDDLGIADRVKIFPRFIPQDEWSVFFSATDLFVLPYVAASQSAALALALGMQVPAIVTDALFGPERMNPGCVVPAGDSVALADAIQNYFVTGEMDCDVPDDRQTTWDEFAETVVATAMEMLKSQ